MGEFGHGIGVWLSFCQTIKNPPCYSLGESPMFRTFTVVFVICLISGLVGCRFCSSPYDYCSPTFTGNNYDFYRGDPCNPNYAAGSRFLGTEEVCSCDTCSGCGGGGCSSCGSGYHEPAAEMIEQPVPAKKVSQPSAKSIPSSVKKIPNPPAPPAVAVPQTIKGVSALKQSQGASQQGETVPKPVVPKASYAKSAVQALPDPALGDPANMLEELRGLNPDAVDVQIIGFEEQ